MSYLNFATHQHNCMNSELSRGAKPLTNAALSCLNEERERQVGGASPNKYYLFYLKRFKVYREGQKSAEHVVFSQTV